jgi:CheY-like chemotaxis protein
MLADSQMAAHVGSWDAILNDDGSQRSLRWSDETYRIFGHAPGVVAIDPGMDGYALATALRAAGHDRAALVAVTGYGQPEDVQRSNEHGFAHHIVKPVDLAALQRITTLHGGAQAALAEKM